MTLDSVKKLETMGRRLAELEERCTCSDCKALIQILVGIMLEAMAEALASEPS